MRGRFGDDAHIRCMNLVTHLLHFGYHIYILTDLFWYCYEIGYSKLLVHFVVKDVYFMDTNICS